MISTNLHEDSRRHQATTSACILTRFIAIMSAKASTVLYRVVLLHKSLRNADRPLYTTRAYILDQSHFVHVYFGPCCRFAADCNEDLAYIATAPNV
jgi:hypothetical protein